MHMYSVIEIQTWADGSVHEIVVPDKGHNPAKTEEQNQNDAFSEYHRILMYAAISANPKHGAMILRNDCLQLAAQCYEHRSEPEQEPEE